MVRMPATALAIRIAISAAMSAIAGAAPAGAAWKQATSTHFIVYSQGSADSAAATAAGLEKYLYVVRALSGTLRKPDSPLKLRVFMQPTVRDVQAMMTYPRQGVGGFYDANIRGAVFIAPRAGAGGGEFGLGSQQIIFHELTHFFAAQYFPAAYPVWYQEGLAEYYGSIRIAADNVATLGGLQEGRLQGFQGNRWLNVRALLQAHGYGDVDEIDLIYAEGWALVHYLSMTKARPGQLAAYLTAVNAGKAYGDAATAAFGDLGKLDDELSDYVHRQRFQALTLPFKQLTPGPIAVRALSPAEDALLTFDGRLTVGVAQGGIGEFADKVEAIAGRFPDDPYALAILAETERLADRTPGERAAVDRWLKVAPTDGFALAAKAQTTMDALLAARSTDEARWADVRRLLVQANKAAPDQPRILAAYYASYARRGALPPEAAQNALYRAYEVLPQDDELRGRVAADFEARGMIDEAIAIIRPVAYATSEKGGTDPREKARRDALREKYRTAGQPIGETPREMLARLESKKARAKKDT